MISNNYEIGNYMLLNESWWIWNITDVMVNIINKSSGERSVSYEGKSRLHSPDTEESDSTMHKLLSATGFMFHSPSLIV